MALMKSTTRAADETPMKTILGYAQKTLALLKERSRIPTNLQAELDSTVKRSLSLPHSILSAGSHSSLDETGVELWNAATNLRRDWENVQEGAAESSVQDQARLIALIRAFAFFLIDASHSTSSRGRKEPERNTRRFKIALKACRAALDSDELELAIKLLERCADHVSATETVSPTLQKSDGSGDNAASDNRDLERLTAEYHLLRVTHGWKAKRLALAEHFFARIDQRVLSKYEGLAEKAADLFHEAGRSLLKQDSYREAVKWCDRALAAIDGCSPERLTQDAPELRLAISASLIDALLLEQPAATHERPLAIVDQLESMYALGNRMTVSLMRLRVLLAGPELDAQSVSQALGRIIKLAVITAKNFNVIMQAIHKTWRRSPKSALSALEDLITTRLMVDLVPGGNDDAADKDRLEKAVITYIMFATSSADIAPSPAVEQIRELLNSIAQREIDLSTKAIHAAQTLIWKAAGAGETPIAEKWCSVLRHTVFDNAGIINKARIGRKAILLSLARGDTNAAREHFFQMPPNSQNESISRYLAFKIALRDHDHDLALESLGVVSKHADKDPTFLYACVLEAQQSNARTIAVAALRSLLDKRPTGIHLPSLLRCTAKLLVSELESQTQDRHAAVEEVVLVFEHAASNVKALRQGSLEQCQAEVQWWSKNAYNLALRHCNGVHPEHFVRLLNVCKRFLDHYADGTGVDDVLHRRLQCHFLCATALIVLARSEDGETDSSIQRSTNARSEIASFMTGLQQLSAAKRAASRMDDKAFELLKFDLECIHRLHKWDDLSQRVDSLLTFQHTDRWETLIDLIVVVHDHISTSSYSNPISPRIPELLQKCINESWKKDKDIVKMTRWLRLAFTIHLNDEKDDFALTILNQAANIARRGLDDPGREPYPDAELQWLSVTAWNKAIDVMGKRDWDGAGKWMNGALELARYSSDNGALHANLTQKKEAAEARLQEQSV